MLWCFDCFRLHQLIKGVHLGLSRLSGEAVILSSNNKGVWLVDRCSCTGGCGFGDGRSLIGNCARRRRGRAGHETSKAAHGETFAAFSGGGGHGADILHHITPYL